MQMSIDFSGKRNKMPLGEVKSKSHHLHGCDLTLASLDPWMWDATWLFLLLLPVCPSLFLHVNSFSLPCLQGIILVRPVALLASLCLSSFCWSISQVSPSEELQPILIFLYSRFTWFSSEYHITYCFIFFPPYRPSTGYILLEDRILL